jgi:PTH1 family peptidyl-tRNA hydrolase
MQLWVGLGNPGPQYAMNRHNVGFMAIDVIADTHQFAPPAKKFQGWLQDGRIGRTRILLLKPGTFMYDELDLAPMKVKVKQGGGAAGHNGIRSMIQHIGDDFRRVRIGIGHPGHKDRVTGHVLGNYHKTEIEPLTDLLGAIAAEASWLAEGDDVRFQNDLALRLQP